MTEQEAITLVLQYEDDDLIDDDQMEIIFYALYGRLPDCEDRLIGLWSLCCAAVIE